MGNDVFASCDNLRCFKLHPDDPELYRDYMDEFLDPDDIPEAIADVYGGFGFCSDIVKFPMKILYYLRTHDEDTADFIQENLSEILEQSIPNGDTVFIADITANTDWIAADDIDELIELADDNDQTEISELLQKYKAEKLGI